MLFMMSFLIGLLLVLLLINLFPLFIDNVFYFIYLWIHFTVTMLFFNAFNNRELVRVRLEYRSLNLQGIATSVFKLRKHAPVSPPSGGSQAGSSVAMTFDCVSRKRE